MTADKLCETCRELMGDASYIITPFFTVPIAAYFTLVVVIITMACSFSVFIYKTEKAKGSGHEK
ncbi:MAG: hypothetical protein FWB96_13615 [Defluviitaleaceae bacterium]|nr:hypothetical protein [Defluviitaleaceae bacterium]MCL2264393.1 hypothetical protein [Defluviitaleaceae bacterium]